MIVLLLNKELSKKELSKFEDDRLVFYNFERTGRDEVYYFKCQMNNGRTTNGSFSIIKETKKDDIFYSFTYRADEITEYIQLKMTYLTNYLLKKIHNKYNGKNLRTVINRKIIQNMGEWEKRNNKENVYSYLSEIEKIHSDIQTEELDYYRYKNYPMVLNGFGKDILYLANMLKELGYADYIISKSYGDYQKNNEVIPHIYIIFNEQKYLNLNGNFMVDIVLYWGERLKNLGFDVLSSCHPEKHHIQREIIYKEEKDYRDFENKLNVREKIDEFPPMTKSELEYRIKCYRGQINEDSNKENIDYLKHCLEVFESELKSRTESDVN